MKKIVETASAIMFSIGLFVASADSDFMPWLNVAGIAMMGGASSLFSARSRRVTNRNPLRSFDIRQRRTLRMGFSPSAGYGVSAPCSAPTQMPGIRYRTHVAYGQE